MPPRNAVQRPRPARNRAKTGTVTFLGETYKVSTQVGIWPLMQFARAAEEGLESGNPRGMAAIHAFLQDIIHPDDWARFQNDMITKKMTNLDELLDTVQQAVTEAMDRASKNGATAEVIERKDT